MTLRFYDACPFGLCSEISPQGIRWRRHQPAAHDLRQGLHRLRGATDRDGRRGRSRSPACGIPAQGGCLQSREQPQRRLQSPAAEGTARHPEALLERRAVVAVLFRFKLRRRADFHRAPVHRAAANSTLKPKDKDGCAVRAILPRPERRDLSRTGSYSIIGHSSAITFWATGGVTIDKCSASFGASGCPSAHFWPLSPTCKVWASG